MREILLIVNPSVVAASADTDSGSLEPVIIDSQSLLRAALLERNARSDREDCRRDIRELVDDLRRLNDRHRAALSRETISGVLERHWTGGLIVVEEAEEWPEATSALLADIESALQHAGEGRRLALRQRALDPARAVDFLALYLQDPDVQVTVAGESAGVHAALSALERLGVPAAAAEPSDMREGDGPEILRDRAA